MVRTVEELRSLSADELMAGFEQQASVVIGGHAMYYLHELERRDLEHHNRVNTRLTWVIAAMTAAMLVATVVNVVLFAVG